MPTNPRVVKAFRAMKALGISEEKVKPVLKRLIKLYDKNWELIEQENYRALADAIFENEDTEGKEEAEAAESKKSENVEINILRKAVLEEEAVDEEPERPLKRSRLRQQEGQASPSTNKGSAAAESCRTYVRNKGKQPVSPYSAVKVENNSRSLRKSLVIKEPNSEPSPRQKVSRTQALIKPKDEPYNLDPIAVIHPESSNTKGSSAGNAERRQPKTSETLPAEPRGETEKDKDVPASSNGLVTCNELEIASSTFGDVKISIDCDLALGRSDFNLPSLEAVLKLVEAKCLKSYKYLDPNFSLTKLMKDVCECFLELGTQNNHEPQVTMTVDAENDTKIFELDAGKPELDPPCNCHDNGKETNESAYVENHGNAPEIPQLDPPCNGHDNGGTGGRKTDEAAYVENCGNAPEIPQPDNGAETVSAVSADNCGNILEHGSSQTLLARCESTNPDETMSCLVTDITKGQEKVMISLVNEVNDQIPPSFRYIHQNVVFQNAYMNFSLARIGEEISCTTCTGDCLSLATPCACACETDGDFAYTKEGLVKEELLKESISMNRDPKKHCQFYCKECPLERSKNEDIVEPCKGHLVRNFIKECWWKCGCGRQCGNRVVQRGISRKLQVFMTPGGKGWGLRTLEDLPRGAFVCEYVGEVLTNAELFDRVSQSPSGEKHSYPVLLDADWGAESVLKDEEALCLDATFYGNVARFINHRCYDSNMVEIPVEIETPDHHYYHLAFFTTRKIKALEELTWDYGIDFDDLEHPVKAFKCHCGSKFCRALKRPRRLRARKGW